MLRRSTRRGVRNTSRQYRTVARLAERISLQPSLTRTENLRGCLCTQIDLSAEGNSERRCAVPARPSSKEHAAFWKLGRRCRDRTAVVAVVAMIAVTAFGEVYAATASARDVGRLGVAIATGIRDNGPATFGTRFVELGAAAIERPWALADWRSIDRTTHGQVLFVYRCDQWNVRVATTKPLSRDQLAAQGVPSTTTAQLIADLSALEHRGVSYVKVGQASVGC